jgi:hypothetical protein
VVGYRISKGHFERRSKDASSDSEAGLADPGVIEKQP